MPHKPAKLESLGERKEAILEAQRCRWWGCHGWNAAAVQRVKLRLGVSNGAKETPRFGGARKVKVEWVVEAF